MRVAIVGGRLQGVEATYLAQRAGWETVVLDRESHVPAAGFADHFVQVELLSPEGPWREIVGECDFIVPALENQAALELLQEFAAAAQIPLAFDDAAYRVSSCKKRSNRLFRSLGLPFPRPYPEAGFPLLAKPASESGSRGVTILHTPQQLSAFREDLAGKEGAWIMEEYMEGPVIPSRCSAAAAPTGRWRSRRSTLTRLMTASASWPRRLCPKPRPGSLKSSPWILPPP